MISLISAIELKKAGLRWQPRNLDFFAIPDRDMDSRIFVISDMLVTIDLIQGRQVVSFQGASEWALDSLITTDAVWIPREDQLRDILEAGLIEGGRPEVLLNSSLSGYRCRIKHLDREMVFEHTDASEAYAAALLFLLRAQS
jgi:hypothetical protein